MDAIHVREWETHQFASAIADALRLPKRRTVRMGVHFLQRRFHGTRARTPAPDPNQCGAQGMHRPWRALIGVPMSIENGALRLAHADFGGAGGGQGCDIQAYTSHTCVRARPENSGSVCVAGECTRRVRATQIWLGARVGCGVECLTGTRVKWCVGILVGVAE